MSTFKVYMTRNFFSPNLLVYGFKKRVPKFVYDEKVSNPRFFCSKNAPNSTQNRRHDSAAKISLDITR